MTSPLDIPIALKPDAFAEACRWIVDNHEREEAHRMLDRFVTALLTSLGYGDGMDIFIEAVGGYHPTPPTGAAAMNDAAVIEELTDEQLRHIAESKDVGACRARIRAAILPIINRLLDEERERCAKVASAAIMAQASVVNAFRGSKEHDLLLRADAAMRKALAVSDQRSPWGVAVPKDWGLCDHEWEEADDDCYFNAVVCKKCGVPGQQDSANQVYWPCT